MQPIALAFWAMTADVDVIARVLRVAGMHASQNPISTRMLRADAIFRV